MPRIGQLGRRLTLEAPTDTADAAGGVDRVWNPLAEVWARVEALVAAGGGERDRADRLELAMRFRVTMRWREGIDGRLRLRDGDRLFAIESAADPDGRRRWLVAVVEEITP